MMNIIHNNYLGRFALTLLFVLSVCGSMVLAQPREMAPECICTSDRLNEIHVPDTTINPELCPPPVADICMDPVEGCAPLTVNFYDYSLGYIDTWEWDFGDPTSGADNFGTGEYPTHIYNTPGLYTVTLMVTGCGGTSTKVWKDAVEVFGMPVSDFSADPRRGCAPTTVQFTNLSVGATVYWWDFGDYQTSRETHPVHTYTMPGVYTVELYAMNDCGKDIKVREQYITLDAGPTADFTSDQTDLCQGGLVTFTDLSTGATSWVWNFGDGTGSPAQHPTHTYTAAGTYPVTLTVRNDCGDDTATKLQYITVRPIPVADFVADVDQFCVGGDVQFTDLSQHATGWEWDFGDGSPASFDQHPSHYYAAPGLYTVELTATNSCGPDTESKQHYIQVNGPPVADFEVPSRRACVNGPVQFNDLSTGAYTWHWNFGDGTTSPDPNPTHQYAAAGTYDVSLYVTNDCGDDTEIKQAYIEVLEGPIADFYASTTQLCVGVEMRFFETATNADTWDWDFGDGTTSQDRMGLHTYYYPGLYTVTLTVTNPCGPDEVTRREYVRVLPLPTANFETKLKEDCNSATLSVIDHSLDAYDYSWDFGDGTTSDQRDPGDHTYTAEGSYTVRLDVSNDCGDDFMEKTVTVSFMPQPVADFEPDNRRSCTGSVINFTNLSVLAYDYYWDFGDGSDSYEFEPSHTYSVAGTYTISLRASNPCGSDLVVKEEYVTIGEGPVADFVGSPTEGCVALEVIFTDLSLRALSWDWNFGDGATSPAQNPTHTYSQPGQYTVSLTVHNDCGPDTEVKELYVTVFGPPVADFTSDKTETCTGAEVTFTDLSTYATSWDWNFGDGTSSPAQHPVHTYSVAGTYSVTLTVSNSCGSDYETRTEYVRVQAGPTADFVGTPLSGQAPLRVAFTDRSTSYLPITGLDWDFGDGSGSMDQNPAHTYTQPGRYTVELTVTNDCGNDTETKVEYVYVYDTCVVDFTADPTIACKGTTVTFQGTSVGACDITAWNWNFGDPTSGSNTASGQSTQHNYDNAGAYTVTLTAVEAGGDIVVTKTNYITVQSGPTAAFVPTPSIGTAPLLVSFDNQSVSTAGGTLFTWDFGDPASGPDDTSHDIHPQHAYVNDGDYMVTLVVTDDCGEDTATALITVTPSLSISKAVDKTVAPVGDQLLYTLTVSNLSNEAITNIQVVDSVPDSTSYLAQTASNGGVYTAMDDIVTWTVASLNPYETTELTFRVLLDGPFSQFPTIVTNIATATFDDGGIATSIRTFVSNRVETVVDIPTGVLGVTKAVSATLAAPSDVLTYTIIVSNSSPAVAYNVTVYDAIPDSTEYVPGSITGPGIYKSANDSLLWSVGTLGAFASQTVSFQARIIGDCPNGTVIPNTALASSSLGGEQSNEVITAVNREPIVITKGTSTPSGMFGDLLRYTITVENFSGQPFSNVRVVDTMPHGIFYVDGSSLRDGYTTADPTGNNPLVWALGDLPTSGTITLKYTALIGATAQPGRNQNVARADAIQTGFPVNSNRATAEVHVLSTTLAGKIRGRVIVDCDDDGIADMAAGPVGMDIYLDDGSHSQVNESGMFYFSTVRPGERVVALDERDLEGFYIPDEAQASVFVHVHETGESYVTFRLCPDYAHLLVDKQAAIVPKVMITKHATINPDQPLESPGVVVDYQIDIASNGRAGSVPVRVVDSLPENTRLIVSDESLKASHDGGLLVYEVTAAREKLRESITYSLRDLAPGEREFLTNRIFAEGEVIHEGEETHRVSSESVSVQAGPLVMAPPQDIKITLTPALFITSMAYLQPPAIPHLEAVADSIMKYADSDVRVEGHTDYRPIHTERFPSNWELGEARAQAVIDWLVENRQINGDRLKGKSFAATVPIVTDVPRTSEALQPNRRTEVIIERKGGVGPIDLSSMPAEGWQKSTTLALDPVEFDTLFEAVDPAADIALDDTWEIVLEITNQSGIAAEGVTVSDILPTGVEYVDGTATVDYQSIAAAVEDGTLRLKIDRIEPNQSLRIRYQVQLLAGQTPSGGGAASVEMTTTSGATVVQSSNDIMFK